jgi:hypothetical protein
MGYGDGTLIVLAAAGHIIRSLDKGGSFLVPQPVGLWAEDMAYRKNNFVIADYEGRKLWYSVNH